jgi:SAM-dependent methyltransferase
VSEWFEHWFGEEYLDLYPHRDDRDAERAVALLASNGFVQPGQRVLDLACGAGRHAAALARCGARVVGLDLSLPLLLRSRRRTAAPLIRGDMRRLPLRDSAFEVVVNLFTSFGYFERDELHQLVLQEVARVLTRGGVFALDFLNATAVRAGLVPFEEGLVGDRLVAQERRVSKDGRFVLKAIHLSEEGRSYMERVRLFERRELETMLASAGLEPCGAFGDYDGVPHTSGTPRLILVARRR